MAHITDSMARRAAKKVELRITTSRQRQHINNSGGYQLLDENNIVVGGVDFDLTTERVVEFVHEWQNGGHERHDKFMEQVAAEMAAQ
jgi:hypothetical protein